MTAADIAFIGELLRERSGLALTSDKTYLLESRLTPIAHHLGEGGVAQLIARIRTRREEAVIVEVVDAMTTNESFFFRDGKLFDLLRSHVLPHLLRTRQPRKSIRIWCAAASTGQEPYTLAMLLREEGARLAGYEIDILATDISASVLARAQAGVYSQFEVQRGLPVQLLIKYFRRHHQGFEIAPEIRSMVRFQEFNLLNSLASLGQFDVVFCRNVLIYFDAAIKTRILDQISRMMPVDGTLFLGAAETVLGLGGHFKPIPGARGIYCQSACEPVFLQGLAS